MKTTADRGEVIHFAGSRHLSPALDAQGAPAFSSEPADRLARCGWASFFRALGERRLAVAFDPADATPVSFVSAAQGADGAASRGGLAQATAHACRFWKAFRGA